MNGFVAICDKRGHFSLEKVLATQARAGYNKSTRLSDVFGLPVDGKEGVCE